MADGGMRARWGGLGQSLGRKERGSWGSGEETGGRGGPTPVLYSAAVAAWASCSGLSWLRRVRMLEILCGMLDIFCGIAERCCGMLDTCCGSTESRCGRLDSFCGMLDNCCGMLDSCCGRLGSCGVKLGKRWDTMEDRFWNCWGIWEICWEICWGN